MFLRNGWYSALWSHELTEKPVGKTFLNDKVVLFRNDGGAGRRAGGLLLPSRRAAVDAARSAGDYLVCGYHGLKFDVNGQCVEVPGQPRGAAGRQGAQLSGA